MKLLIVDDQRSVHLYIQEVIDLPSLKVSKVQHAESSGMQALELLRRCHLDLMILDIQIIDMNGVALAEVLRQEKIVYSETVVLTIYNEFLCMPSDILISAYADMCSNPSVPWRSHSFYAKPIRLYTSIAWKAIVGPFCCCVRI